MREKNMRLVIQALLDPANWRPNLTKISKDTGVPVSTVYDNISWLLYNELIVIKMDVDLNLEDKKNGSAKNTNKQTRSRQK